MYKAKSPYCEHVLDPETAVDGWVTCECGRRSDVRWVSELAWLQARGEWVADRVADGSVWFDTSNPNAPQPIAQGAPGQESLGQKALYALGGFSMVIAVVVFTAMSWGQLGAVGQLLSLLGITALFGALAIWSRSRLSGLAQTSAVLASSVLLVTGIAAPQFGLLPSRLSELDSGYPFAVVVFVGLVSLALGWRFRVAGWALVAPLLLAPAALIFTYGMLQSFIENQGWPIGSTAPLVGLTLFIAASDRLGDQIASRRPEWSALDLVASLASLTLAGLGLLIYPASAAFAQDSRWGGLVIWLAAAIWGHIAFRWRPQEYRTPVAKFILNAARWIATLGVSLGLVTLLTPRGVEAGSWQVWLAFVASAALGSVAFLSRLLPWRAVPAMLADAFGISLWALSWMSLSSVYFEGASHAYPMITFFFIIAAAGAVRWLQFDEIIGFLLSISSGAVGLAILVVEVARDSLRGPEPVTFTLALWCFLAFALLRRRTPDLNSAVWLGIPFATAMLPSAAAAVVLLQNPDGVLTMDWVRFWGLLVLGAVMTVVGTEWRISGVLWPGALAYLFTALPQLWVDLGLPIPRWVFFAFLSLLLIVLAARFERLNRLRAEMGSWSDVFR